MTRRMFPRLATFLLLAGVAWPSGAAAHGGITIADGQRSGVTFLVQGTEAATPGGKPAADLSTTLDGPGTGPKATVVYWVRPSGGTTFKVETERDASGVRHAEIATAGRGDWHDWDVSAVLTLSDGERLRVTNAAGNPPGPDPAAAPKPTAAETTPTAADAASEEPTLSEGPTTPDVVEEPADTAPVDDISGESDGAPGWVVPSLGVLLVLSAAAVLVTRRRRHEED